MRMLPNLVLCIDGTWNTKTEHAVAHSCPSNVARISEILVNDEERQIVHYLHGIGTTGLTDRMIGGVYGAGITGRISEGYRWLCNNFRPGVRVGLFGFSRGAFAVRSIIGVIANVGILETEYIDRVNEAISIYRGPPRLRNAEEFRRRYSCDTELEIKFIGVWDTVARYGPLLWPIRWTLQRLKGQRFNLYDSWLPDFVESAYQALALDEVRETYLPLRWRAHPEYKHPEQQIEETWFCGGHSDVGGGYCDDSRAADFPLSWMVTKAIQAGFLFKTIPEASNESHLGLLHDESHQGGWRLLPKVRRVIEDGDSFHESVFRRMDTTSYAPKAYRQHPNN